MLCEVLCWKLRKHGVFVAEGEKVQLGVERYRQGWEGGGS